MNQIVEIEGGIRPVIPKEHEESLRQFVCAHADLAAA